MPCLKCQNLLPKLQCTQVQVELQNTNRPMPEVNKIISKLPNSNQKHATTNQTINVHAKR